jgi:NAD(P)-dependent dehydrogenase (short-subunit alcohol dehydrogenase family)
MSSPPASASELAGRVAIVTGGSRGLGAAIAETIGRAGARVVVADIEMTRASERAAALNQLDIDAVAMPLDVGDEEQVRHLIDAVSMRYGKLDALINNAGVDFTAPAVDLSVAQWDRVVRTNLTGPFLMIKHALSLLGHGSRIQARVAQRGRLPRHEVGTARPVARAACRVAAARHQGVGGDRRWHAHAVPARSVS